MSTVLKSDKEIPKSDNGNEATISDESLDLDLDSLSSSPKKNPLEIEDHGSDDKSRDITELRESKKQLEAQILRLEAALSEKDAELVHLKSHFFNELKKHQSRSEREIEKAKLYSLTSFIKDFFPAVDSLSYALAQAVQSKDNPEVAALTEGLALTEQQILTAFSKAGLERIRSQKGEIFDPRIHEAMSTKISSEVEPGKILESLQDGYRLNDRILRAALVIVADAEKE